MELRCAYCDRRRCLELSVIQREIRVHCLAAAAIHRYSRVYCVSWSVPALGTGPMVGKLSHGMAGRMRLSVRAEGLHPPIQGSCETRLRNEVLKEMQMEPGRCCALGLPGKGTSELGTQVGLGAISIHSFSSDCGD